MAAKTNGQTGISIEMIIKDIIKLVPVNYWAFGQVSRGSLEISADVSSDMRNDIFSLNEELLLQRVKTPSGAKMSATLSPSAVFPYGVTLILGDSHSTFGILVLLRDQRLGAFSFAELHMLAIALATANDFFHTRAEPHRDGFLQARSVRGPGGAPLHSDDAFYVLDRRLRIKYAYAGVDQRSEALPDARPRSATGLPKLLERTVRELTASWHVPPFDIAAGFARPVPFLTVRTQPMSGVSGLHIGVRVERFRVHNSLTQAALRFRITPREVQVLMRLLDGMQLEEIGTSLKITVSTVQDHVRNMIEKTASRNRSELLGRVLGWESDANWAFAAAGPAFGAISGGGNIMRNRRTAE